LKKKNKRRRWRTNRRRRQSGCLVGLAAAEPVSIRRDDHQFRYSGRSHTLAHIGEEKEKEEK